MNEDVVIHRNHRSLLFTNDTIRIVNVKGSALEIIS
jgi:hypothetical protein